MRWVVLCAGSCAIDFYASYLFLLFCKCIISARKLSLPTTWILNGEFYLALAFRTIYMADLILSSPVEKIVSKHSEILSVHGGAPMGPSW